MIYSSEALAVRRVFWLARSLGVWPGYFYSRIAGGWVLTYDPQSAEHRGDYEGRVLL